MSFRRIDTIRGGWDVTVRRVDSDGVDVELEEPRTHYTQPDQSEIERVLKADGWVEKKKGRLYTVDIPEDHQYLDWDKQIDRQPDSVQTAVPTIERVLGEDVSKWTGEEVYRALAEHASEAPLPGFESDVDGQNPEREASQYLSSLGLAGIKYLDGQSRAAGEGSHNYVVFDDKAVKILEYEQNQRELKRGAIRFGNDRKFTIELLGHANLSTFLHETGHLYLEVLGDLAERAEASPGLRDDYQQVLKWLGVDSRDKLGREQHEQWARGFEAYLMEGKAPSPRLAEAFRRFKGWLLSIYPSIHRLGVNLTPDRHASATIRAPSAECSPAFLTSRTRFEPEKSPF